MRAPTAPALLPVLVVGVKVALIGAQPDSNLHTGFELGETESRRWELQFVEGLFAGRIANNGNVFVADGDHVLAQAVAGNLLVDVIIRDVVDGSQGIVRS